MTMTSRIAGLFAALALTLICGTVHADVFRPAYLELRQQDADTYDVLWKMPAQDGPRPTVHVRMPESTQVLQPPRTEVVAGAYIERSRVRLDGGLHGETVAIDGLAGTDVEALVRIVRLDGSEQVTRLLPAAASFTVASPAGGSQVALTYFKLGVYHILAGFDHLLFVLALMLIVRGFRRVIVTITAFTIAHSITLAAATLGFVNVPSAPVEATIALSIVFVAAEIVRGLQGLAAFTARWPWLVAFIFGLLHGLGFAGALHEVGLPQSAVPSALFFFNVGVEAGQLLFIGAVALLTTLMRHLRLQWPRWAEYVPAYAIGSIAMFWVIERAGSF